MRTWLSSVVLVLALATVAIAKPTTITSKSEKFSIRFPGAVEEAYRPVPAAPETKLHLYSHAVTDQFVLLLMIADVPGDHALDLDDSKYVEKGTLISRKDLEVGGYPARETRVQLPGDMVMRARVVLVKRRYYQIMSIGTRAEVDGRVANAYVTSFRVTK